jgi:tRNA pseudouridine32 synthase/23S rRNA pseudouridine746 synthase
MEDLIALYADATLLVFDKPSGLLSVPGRGPDKADCLATRAQTHWPDALTVHRLDMDTSGLIVMARGAAAQRRLSQAFAAREVGKRYIAIVAGCVADDAGTVALPLAADWPNRPLQKVDHESGKPSVTHWRVLERGADATRLELEPVSGRSHQLRVHMKALGHPILGDPLYAPAAVRRRAARLQLHASHLQFAHPTSGEPLEFASVAPF